ncbi:beta-glucosidase [Cellulomonas fimi]|uniref:Glycoside hydrolase family 3 domain protein n=1 Tax=Cellulomonas fimi (strain ATCC 484 / DSM 20113 / JCM 1341 / CCUG 24087 / LMG 16345 / NBRC 15513 / NCIMB 8980 / NCTC 7547 / NRS-133) TaxID=590998 RepID=F4H851_CELFA|nr:glycoside hydrolase family 3 C-terminal domain-containing protein [Cellulomonas fimi]AEE44608.1 glycoside hydrolase family 3 domain protein [Cellulomonas fimi ATCC 484]NNH08793.1 beta-glucosidase [Cellulomonas fimi]VEH26769.1 Thermostable beta-glucosidase B [Cellulomonas fimi]
MSTQTPRTTQADEAALLAALTTEEKVRLVVGAGLWSTTAVPRIGLRAMHLSDGPAGVRGVTDDPTETAASFPAPSALAATWDRDLADEVGALFAAEARRHGVDVVLAPQVNLQRTPVGGRHFECYSEDPLLTGEIAVHVVRSAQDRGVGMCVKHFVANDSETERTTYVSRVDERTLREVYLAPFERLVREARAWSVMGAYSGVDDGTTAAPVLEHRPLLTGVLKDEWGFDGVVVSDWVATNTVEDAAHGGLDLQMPGPDGPWGDGLLDAVRDGRVSGQTLDDKVLRVLRLAGRVGALDGVEPAGERRADVADVDVRAVLRRLVGRSMVVLRDTDHGLPAAPGDVRRVALLGPNAVSPFVQGGGSAYVRPERSATPADALAAAFAGAEVDVHAGAVSRMLPPQLDLAARCTDPDGQAGALVELLDADGTVLDARTTTSWGGWLRDVRADAVTVRLRTTVRLDEPGRHEVGVGTVGRHLVAIGGRVVSRGDRVVGAEVILDSSVNQPVPTTVVLDVTEPTTVEVDAHVQAVHPVGYASFARAELVHRTPGTTPDELLADAVAAAAAADLAVVVVGTNEEIESEGYDRTSLALPGTQDQLVKEVVAANPRTVVVVNAGAPVLLPWLDETPCVVWGWLGGQEWPEALADVLTGATEPSGRLPWTLPAHEDDVPVPDAVPVGGVVDYHEGVHVGYRSWLRLGRTPAAPFGHGLGWTTWDHEHAEVAARTGDGDLLVDVTVVNTGTRAGREVVQVYVEPPTGTGEDRPVRWLGGFAVVHAGPGGRATTRVHVRADALRTWDIESHGWVTPAGTYTLRVGRSSGDLRLSIDVDVPSSPAHPSAPAAGTP